VNAAAWTAVIMAATAAATIIGWAVRHTWRIMRRTSRFMDDYFGQEARDGMPAVPGVMARLAVLEKIVHDIRTETQPNGGTSMRDAVNRTAEDVAAAKAALGALTAQIAALQGIGGKKAP